MKLLTVYLSRVVAVMAVSVIIAGCAITIKTDDIQQLQSGSPLKSINPKIFAFKEFKDIRGLKPSYVGTIRFSKINLDVPTATVVATAIKRELERNGHVCVVDKPGSKANFVIEGVVYKYWIREDSSFFTVKIIGDVAIKLTVSAVANDKNVLIRNYAGEYYLSSGFGVPRNSWEAISNQALLEMVKEISTDPEFIGFIEN